MKVCTLCKTESDSPFCPNCGTKMPQDDSVAPKEVEMNQPANVSAPPPSAPTPAPTPAPAPVFQPRPPKPFYKKGWFIGLAILIALIFIGVMLTVNDQPETASNDATTVPTTTEQITTEATTEESTEPTEETKAKFDKNDYKKVAYKNLARNPDKYEYESITNSGRVIQVMDGEDEIQLRVAVADDYDKVVLLAYSPSIMKSRILEDDYITYYGTSAGVITYESTMGGNITIPGIYATKIVIE